MSFEDLSADNMFEELCYTLTENNEANIRFYNKTAENYIIFLKKTKEIWCSTKIYTLKELRAINKKCFELGWL